MFRKLANKQKRETKSNQTRTGSTSRLIGWRVMHIFILRPTDQHWRPLNTSETFHFSPPPLTTAKHSTTINCTPFVTFLVRSAIIANNEHTKQQLSNFYALLDSLLGIWNALRFLLLFRFINFVCLHPFKGYKKCFILCFLKKVKSGTRSISGLSPLIK